MRADGLSIVTMLLLAGGLLVLSAADASADGPPPGVGPGAPPGAGAGAKPWGKTDAPPWAKSGGPPGGKPGGPPAGLTGAGWEVRSALFPQLQTRVDDGGQFSVMRAVVEAGFRYAWAPTRSVGFGMGYRYDGYDFHGGGRFGQGPWSSVHSIRLSVPVLWSFCEKWRFFGVPLVRTTVEDGAPIEDGVTGGGFLGISYRFSDRLSIGPGVGLLTEIEDDPSVFPVVLVDWKITPKLTLRTGRGLGSTQGPGVFLLWQPSKTWELSLGGRIERNRFRLDDRGVAPGGVGEESSFGVVTGVRHSLSPTASFNASFGLNFEGELRLEDARGRLLDRQDYDPALFLGFGIDLRF